MIRKIKRGDKHAEYEFEKKKDKQRKKQIERTNSGIARRLIKFAEKTTDKFFENLTALGTAIFANVVAVAVNTAVNASLIWSSTFIISVSSDIVFSSVFVSGSSKCSFICCFTIFEYLPHVTFNITWSNNDHKLTWVSIEQKHS